MDLDTLPILPFYDNLLESFIKYLQRIKKHPKKSIIHKSRIIIKDFKAIQQLFDFNNSENSILQDINFLFRIYNRAGKIREAQINIVLAKKYLLNKKTIKKFRYTQKQIIYKQTRKIGVCSKRTLIDLNTFNFEPLYMYLKTIDEEQLKFIIKSFIIKQTTSIREQMLHLIDFSIMHDIRKMLKSIKTAYTLVKKPEELKLKSVFSELKKCEKKIGRWHDLLIFTKSLSDFQNAQQKNFSEIDVLIQFLTAELLTFSEEIKGPIEAIVELIELDWQ